jgi:hypothetical protein
VQPRQDPAELQKPIQKRYRKSIDFVALQMDVHTDRAILETNLSVTGTRKLLAAGLGLALLFPLFYQAATGHVPPWMPWRVSEFWRFSALFSQRADAWPAYYVVLVDDAGTRRQIPQRPIASTRLYGHFTRLDRLLLVLDRESSEAGAGSVKRRILDPIGRAYAEQAASRPSGPGPDHRIRSVLFIRTVHPSHLDHPTGTPWLETTALLDEDNSSVVHEVVIHHE